MIKFRADQPDGQILLGFGISAENVKRLQEGQPILIKLSDMGLNGKMMIFYGETEGDLIESIQPYIGPNTKVDNPL